MEFLDLEHQERYNELVTKAKMNMHDKERKSLFYIIAGNEDLYDKVKYIYDFKENSINPNCFSDVDFSSGSKALIRLGFNLYNSYTDEYTSPIDILSKLDTDNINLAIEVLKIRFM